MKKLLIVIIALIQFVAGAQADKRENMVLLQRIHNYAASIDTTCLTPLESYSYARMELNVERRNPLLMLVPTVYAIAHGPQRQYISEVYSKVIMRGYHNYTTQTLLRTTTVPHHRHSMTSLAKYLTPDIYEETIIDHTLLSPFHPANFKFYRYHIVVVHNNTIHLRFTPKRYNTQLVRGNAEIDPVTGRIIRCGFSGEYDMVNFFIQLEMGRYGLESLIPARCATQFKFRFMMNRVTGHMTARYGLSAVLPDSITKEDNYALMCRVRPDTLSPDQQALYHGLAEKHTRDSIQASTGSKHKRNWTKRILWDAIGDNLLNHIKTHFGLNNSGYVRINPMLNPLYMGYDHHRGFTYKFDIRASYQLSDNSETFARFKAGYAFKQKQFYFRLPIYYYFNKRRNGYLKAEVGNGSHIRSQSVRQDIENAHPDTLGTGLSSYDLLNEFRQTDARLVFNYDISSKLSFQVGALYQRKDAIHKYAFKMLGRESAYSSFAPLLELQYRPWGWPGPIFTIDYDRSFKKIFRSNTAYERMEFNGEYIYHINQLQSLQMRVGTGFYTHRHNRAYFLNYENFKENNIPGGWNDDWSGEFELLRSDNYNTSDYYVRANFTYESPLLLLSWLPWVGHYMEMERIYVSALDARNAHPYLEFGYGFTSRVISAGFFVSNGKNNRTIGCKFGFELFRHW